MTTPIFAKLPLFSLLAISIFITSCTDVEIHKQRYSYYKHSTDIKELTNTKYSCLMKSQQRIITTKNDEVYTVLDQIHTRPGYSENKIITNYAIYSACMNSHGYFLTENIKIIKTMLSASNSIEEISRITELSVTSINELLEVDKQANNVAV